jgi:nitrogen fixation protein FixH
MTYQPGQFVRFTHPVSSDEAHAVMIVVEDRGERVAVIDQRHGSWAIKPTAVYAKSELIQAGAQS